MLGGARAKRYELLWSSPPSRDMKVWNRELSYHAFLLVVLGVAAVYTLLAINGSLSPSQIPHELPSRILACSDKADLDQQNSNTNNNINGERSTPTRSTTSVANIAFGLAAGSELWENRKGYIKAWWKPGEMRGAVWLDKVVREKDTSRFPELRVSEDTSRFNYTYSGRAPAKRQKPQLRICRIVLETFRLRLPDIHWFLVGDDDTVFITENVARVLSKYDHTQFHYIGAISETHRQNTVDDCCTNHMAYGGAGYAISSALAQALDGILDKCMERYTDLYGGSSRIHACLLELGVPLTREPGFHQLDINGDASGILGAHPIAPLLSLHHLDVIKPLFPNMSRQRSIEHLLSASSVDSAGVLQQSLCYSTDHQLSIQVSWGWAVQVTRLLLPPRVLQNPIRTFAGWGVPSLDESFEFRTRGVAKNPCERPVMFFMQSVSASKPGSNGVPASVSEYFRAPSPTGCSDRNDALARLDRIRVHKEAVNETWFLAPRRQCCRIVRLRKRALHLHISDCRNGELSAIL